MEKQKCRLRYGVCNSVAVAGGLCRNHYDELVEMGKAGAGIPCSEPDCVRYSVVRGMCRRHYQFKRRKGELEKRTCLLCPEPVAGSSLTCSEHVDRTCAISECKGSRVAKGLCSAHYQAEWRKSRKKTEKTGVEW